MNIALLNERITIQKAVTESDSIGNHRAVWTDYYSCAATVSGESSGEDAENAVTVDNTKADFTVRWCNLLSDISNTEYRVIFRGQLYDILSVDHLSYKKKRLKLKCRKARR